MRWLYLIKGNNFGLVLFRHTLVPQKLIKMP